MSRQCANKTVKLYKYQNQIDSLFIVFVWNSFKLRRKKGFKKLVYILEEDGHGTLFEFHSSMTNLD